MILNRQVKKAMIIQVYGSTIDSLIIQGDACKES
jgi:hypothetical protein